MKAIKATGSVFFLVFLTIVMGLYLAFGVIALIIADTFKAGYRRFMARLRGQPQSPARRFQTAAVKVYPAVPGLVMDEDGFVEPPSRGLHLVVSNQADPSLAAKKTSVATLHGMTAAQLVASHQGAGLLAFPEAGERDRRKSERLARQAVETPPLPANVLRISDFKPKKKV